MQESIVIEPSQPVRGNAFVMGELVHTSGLVESEQVTRTQGAGKRAGELRRKRKEAGSTAK